MPYCIDFIIKLTVAKHTFIKSNQLKKSLWRGRQVVRHGSAKA